MNARHACRRPAGVWVRCGLLLALAVAPLHAPAAADVRILIDVSGSMRENDPDNLRVPAVKLVSDLLPAGTTAGMWLFAEGASELVPPGSVDAAWREQARRQADSIHARGLFTDLERALAAATADWSGPGTPGQRHVVLLTDGVVDVAKDTAMNAASRARILASQLEQLIAQGAQVHAIALSAHVDHELLDALTAGTGGWLESAGAAAELERTFLHMLEASAPPVTVPLVDNGFDIDAAVSELTLLVFREAGDKTRLHAPDGSVLTAATVRSDLLWRSEPGYDLVTVAAPSAGHWHFDGASNPDNRAVVVTDLALALEPFPRRLLADEATALRARLTEQGAPVTRLELLETVSAGAGLMAADAAATTPAATALTLDRNALAFTADTFTAGLAPGNYTLTITVDSGTFKRELRQPLEIAAAPVTLELTPDAAHAAVTVTLAIEPDLVVPAGLRGFVTATDPNGTVQAFVVPALIDGTATLTVPATASGAHTIAAHLYLGLADGRTLALAPPAQDVNLTLPSAPVAAAPAPPTAFSAVRFALYTLGGNLALGLALGLLWWSIGRRRTALPPAPALPATEAVPA